MVLGYLQFVTTPTADTPGTALVFRYENKHYLIGHAAEGLQRACTSTGTKMVGLSDFILTGRLCWRTVGGLMGAIITLADSVSASITAQSTAKPKPSKGTPTAAQRGLNIHGGPNLTHTMAAFRNLAIRQGANVNPIEYRTQAKSPRGPTPPPSFDDQTIKMWALPVLPKGRTNPTTTTSVLSQKRSHGALDESGNDDIRKRMIRFMFESFTRRGTGDGEAMRGIRKVALPPTTERHEALSYVIQPSQPIRGKFHPEKAQQFKIPRSRYKELVQRKTVVTEDGITVTPDMVMDEDRVGAAFAVFDLPSADYVEPLLERDELKSAELMDNVKAIVWILGYGVGSHPRVREYISNTSGIQHIFSSPDYCPNRISFDGNMNSTRRLRQVEPDRYPELHHDSALPQKSFLNLEPEPVLPLPDGVIAADRLLQITLEPALKIVPQAESSFVPWHKVQDFDISKALALAEKAREDIRNNWEEVLKSRRSLPLPETEIITLGTGSAIPSKHRNVSSTLVRVPGYGNYILDCGENTLGQLQRMYGPEELIGVLKDLRMIWISHGHLDHNLGMMSVMKAWYQVVHKGQPDPVHGEDSKLRQFLVEQFEDTKAKADTKGEVSLKELGRCDRLTVIADPNVCQYLKEYSSVEDIGLSRTNLLFISKDGRFRDDLPAEARLRSELWQFPFIPVRSGANGNATANETTPYQPPIPREMYPWLFGLADLEAVSVNHIQHACAVKMTWPFTDHALRPAASRLGGREEPLSIAYSGDCMPERQFWELAKDVTVLVHEATLAAHMRADARLKRHSTTEDAIHVGRLMNAHTVVLTHLSQRFAKGAPVSEEEEEQERRRGGWERALLASAAGEAEKGKDGDVVEERNYPKEALAKRYVWRNGHGYVPPSPGELRPQHITVAFDFMKTVVGRWWEMDALAPAVMELLRAEGEKGVDDDDVVNV